MQLGCTRKRGVDFRLYRFRKRDSLFSSRREPTRSLITPSHSGKALAETQRRFLDYTVGETAVSYNRLTVSPATKGRRAVYGQLSTPRSPVRSGAVANELKQNPWTAMNTPISSAEPATYTQWFYANNANETVGPVPFDELKRLAEAGTIQGDTFVIEEGGSEWKRFSSVALPPIPNSLPPPLSQHKTPLEAKGANGRIALFSDRLCITRGGIHAIGKKSKTEIPLNRIQSIRWQPAGTFKPGFLQFLLLEAKQPTGGAFSVARDQNAVTFTRQQQSAFEQIKGHVEPQFQSRRLNDKHQATPPLGSHQEAIPKSKRGLLASFFGRSNKLPRWLENAVAVVMAVIVLAVLIAALSQRHSDNAGSSSATVSSVPPEEATKQQVSEMMKAEFGDDLKEVEVIPQVQGGYYVRVAYNQRLGSVVNMKAKKDNIDRAMSKAYEKLYTSGIPIRRAAISVFTTFTDKFGKESQDAFYQTELDEATAKQIRWDRRDHLDFTELWRITFILPDFERRAR